MAHHPTFVVVGAGLTGAKAVETLRAEGFSGRVVLLGEEAERPYLRPPLSKDYLLGREPLEAGFVHPEPWYHEHDVDLRTATRAVALDLAERTVHLSGGERVGYAALLLATGAAPRRLTVPGADLAGVHYLRTARDAAGLRSALAGGGARVVIAGAGWIGLEVAAAARGHGNTVTVVGRDTVPLAGAIGAELGGVFAGLHRDHGVRLLLPAELARLRGDGGRVEEVVLADGARLPADLVVVGIGAVPQVGLAQSAGLPVDNGVRVDAHLRTDHPDVYAAGDVANAFHPALGQHLRVEHWANARAGGATAARAMLGRPAVHDHVPYFYTDQYDVSMEYVGYPSLAQGAQVVYRGDVPGRRFIAFWVTGGRVVAGMSVNVAKTKRALEALVRSGEPVDAARLSDEAVGLTELTAARTSPS